MCPFQSSGVRALPSKSPAKDNVKFDMSIYYPDLTSVASPAQSVYLTAAESDGDADSSSASFLSFQTPSPNPSISGSDEDEDDNHDPRSGLSRQSLLASPIAFLDGQDRDPSDDSSTWLPSDGFRGSPVRASQTPSPRFKASRGLRNSRPPFSSPGAPMIAPATMGNSGSSARPEASQRTGSARPETPTRVQRDPATGRFLKDASTPKSGTQKPKPKKVEELHKANTSQTIKANIQLPPIKSEQYDEELLTAVDTLALRLLQVDRDPESHALRELYNQSHKDPGSLQLLDVLIRAGLQHQPGDDAGGLTPRQKRDWDRYVSEANAFDTSIGQSRHAGVAVVVPAFERAAAKTPQSVLGKRQRTARVAEPDEATAKSKLQKASSTSTAKSDSVPEATQAGSLPPTSKPETPSFSGHAATNSTQSPDERIATAESAAAEFSPESQPDLDMADAPSASQNSDKAQTYHEMLEEAGHANGGINPYLQKRLRARAHKEARKRRRRLARALPSETAPQQSQLHAQEVDASGDSHSKDAKRARRKEKRRRARAHGASFEQEQQKTLPPKPEDLRKPRKKAKVDD